MKINDLKSNLQELTKEELIKSIVDLYKKSEFVKDYYASKYADGSNLSILIKHKKVIENEFFPARGHGQGRLIVAKKAITEFNKLSDNKKSMAELMLFYVEVGVKYTDCYGDIDEPFYLSMESMYERAMKHIMSNNLIAEFNDRCLKIVNNTVNMGWGFHDRLCEIYYEYTDD
jgi:hypothetical protein